MRPIENLKLKKLEASLRESEARAEAEIQHQASFPLLNPNPVLELDFSGTLRFCNPATRDILHRMSLEDVQCFYPKDLPWILEQAAQGCLDSYQQDVRVGDKIFSESIYLASQFKTIRIYAQDVTESRRAQKTLFENEERFRALAENIPDLITQFDSNLRLLYANPAVLRRTGLPLEALVGRTASEYGAPSAENTHWEQVARAVLGSGEPQRYEHTNHWQGETRVFDVQIVPERNADNTVRAVIAIARDITDRKQTEENLQKNENELKKLNRTLKALSNSSQAMMHAVSEPEYLNEVCKIIAADCCHPLVWIGYAANNEGKTIQPMAFSGFEAGYLETLNLTWEDAERGRGPTGTAIRTKKVSFCKNMLTDPAFEPWRLEAIKRGYAASLALPLMDGGQSFGALTIYFTEPDPFSDDEVRLLSELADDLAYGIMNLRLRITHAQAAAALQEANRRKDEFLATLAHELRNPLVPIRNAAHILTMQGPTNSKLVHVCGMIERQVEHMAHLVDDLLDVSRIEHGKIELQKENVDFSRVLSRAVEACRPSLDEKQQNLKLKLPDHSVTLDGDPIRLEQITVNLLNNAVKYTPNGGTIHLTAAAQDSTVALTIRDEGIGMTPETLKNIFELFYQADNSMDRSQGGLGIGLTLVKRLVQLHGGSVTAFSAGLGHGSEFILVLPVIEAAPDMLPGRKKTVQRRPTSQKHILVIDDNESILRSMEMLLHTYGLRVSVAKDGEMGVKQALALHPDIALVDLGLPKLNGLETAARIRAALGKTIILIALSGYAQKQDKANAFAHGFDKYLVKPIDPQELVRVLNEAGTIKTGVKKIGKSCTKS